MPHSTVCQNLQNLIGTCGNRNTITITTDEPMLVATFTVFTQCTVFTVARVTSSRRHVVTLISQQ